MAKPYLNPEPVPPASQLAVLPFLGAVDGFLRDGVNVLNLRITAHRAISREGKGYLQQVCPYLEADGANWRGVGRIYPVDEGVIGAAFENGRIWRTKSYARPELFLPDLLRSMRESGDQRSPDEVAWSYLAVPFLGPDDQVVLILYADCKNLNFFADDFRVGSVVSMCRGFCRLFDSLQKDPFPNLRNFPLQRGEPIVGSNRTVYRIIQESLGAIETPKFSEVSSFNYEASAA